MQSLNKPKKIDWTNTLFLTITPLMALIATPIYFYHKGFFTPSLILFVVFLFLTGLSITAGYHRLFAHKAYQANPIVRFFWLCFGAAAFQNSALKWSNDHRNHHQFVDGDYDPYNIKNGFWYAHILWILYKENPKVALTQVPDLSKDPLIQFQHRHIFALGTVFGLILPAALGALWGDAWGGFLLAGLLRIVLNHHFTFFINSLAHTIGSRPYSEQNSARDSWILAFLTYGEGYHNFHHAFPSDYRNGIRFYQWDPSKWLIWCLQKIGLAKNLKRIAPQTTLLAKIKKQEMRLTLLLKEKRKQAFEGWHSNVLQARKSFEEACEKFYAIKNEYKKLKKQKTERWQSRLKNLENEMQVAKFQFKTALQNWKKVYRGYQLILSA